MPLLILQITQLQDKLMSQSLVCLLNTCLIKSTQMLLLLEVGRRYIKQP
jgi:hypothetical protein